MGNYPFPQHPLCHGSRLGAGVAVHQESICRSLGLPREAGNFRQLGASMLGALDIDSAWGGLVMKTKLHLRSEIATYLSVAAIWLGFAIVITLQLA